MFTSKPPTCAGRTLALPRKDRDIRYLRPLGNSDIAAIRGPRALKAVCGRLEIVDRRDDHALISSCGAPSPPQPLSPNDDRASASDAYAWRADRGTREPNRRAGRSCNSSGVRACSAAGAVPHATSDDAGTVETLLIQWQWWRRRDSNPKHTIFQVHDGKGLLATSLYRASRSSGAVVPSRPRESPRIDPSLGNIVATLLSSGRASRSKPATLRLRA